MSRFLNNLASSRITLCAVLVICLLLRVGLAVYKGDAEVVRDAYNYVQIGTHIADGKGFVADRGYGTFLSGRTHPTAYGNPIYPTFLALIFVTIGDGMMGVALVQAVVDTISCFLVFLMLCRLTGRPLAGVIGALVYALYPPFILSTSVAMTETLTILLTLVAVYALVLAFRSGVWRWILAGALMGLLILLKPAMLAFPFAVALMLLVKRRYVQVWALKAVLYVTAAYLVVCPWTIRNYLVLHAFVPVATHGGATFWGGTGPADGVCLGGYSYPVDTKERSLYDHPRVPDVSEDTFQKITKLQAELDAMGEVERDNVLMRAGMQEIREHPGRYAFLAVKKLFRFWFNLWHDFPPSAQSKAIAVLNALILVLGVLGYVRSKIDEFFKTASLYIAGYTMLLSMAIYAHVRYSYPVMPFVIMLGSVYAAERLFGDSSKECN